MQVYRQNKQVMLTYIILKPCDITTEIEHAVMFTLTKE